MNKRKNILITLVFFGVLNIFGTCRFSMRDVSIPAEIKTVKINMFENRARYINPQLAPRLTDKLRQKIINQTRLSQTNSDAHYEITATITDYSQSTSGITDRQTSSNNLNVTVHLQLVNRLDNKKNIETDITRSFPFSGNLSLSQAETQLGDQMVNNITDEIFNRIFSNW
ncbi:MAG: hypothetical protein K9I82_10855 [Chitinophagaceae bacterium]|jgi:hypothetical protein|nr:hypothetical protein [Chitinophagaceae bacterium]